jgi:hypothetical protein
MRLNRKRCLVCGEQVHRNEDIESSLRNNVASIDSLLRDLQSGVARKGLAYGLGRVLTDLRCVAKELEMLRVLKEKSPHG